MSETDEFSISPTLRRRLRRLGVVVLVLAGATTVVGVGLRWRQDVRVRTWTAERAVPVVSVVGTRTTGASSEVVLPGTVRAFIDAPIYARVGGYLRSWTVDIGAQVHAGQVLATIETPELDQQLLQAKADLATARANESLSATTSARWQRMLAADSVSKQEADEKLGDHAAKSAIVAAAEANVARLQATASFKTIVAPFSGTITARRTDIGALINPGAGTGQELFRLADAHKVRVYVEVPQSYTASLRVGSTALLRVPERPDARITATVTDAAHALSETSRTMLVQLEAGNADGTLLPGSYVDVHFPMSGRAETPRLPVSALIFRRQGLQVAVLGPGDAVELRTLTLGRDFGTEVEVSSGLRPGERVIDNPPDGLDDGTIVRVAGEQRPAAAGRLP